MPAVKVLPLAPSLHHMGCDHDHREAPGRQKNGGDDGVREEGDGVHDVPFSGCGYCAIT